MVEVKKMTDFKAQKDSEVFMTELVLPNDTNLLGNLRFFGSTKNLVIA